MFDFLLTALVGIFVEEEFFRLIVKCSVNITLVRIFIKVFITKIMNFAAADEKNRINNESGKRGRREQKLGEASKKIKEREQK